MTDRRARDIASAICLLLFFCATTASTAVMVFDRSWIGLTIVLVVNVWAAVFLAAAVQARRG